MRRGKYVHAGVRSAVVGTALGALAGAAIGGNSRGAGVGAGVGLLAGSAAGAGAGQQSGYALQRRYDHAYQQCMYAKGHRVPVAGRYGATEQRAYTPPPPPPGSHTPPPPAPSASDRPAPPPPPQLDKWNDAHSIWRGKIGYVNGWKLFGIFFIYLLWVRTGDWINRDSQIFDLGYGRWNPAVYFPFAVVLVS